MNYKKITIASLGILTMLSLSIPVFAANQIAKPIPTKTTVTTQKPIKKVTKVKKVTPKVKKTVKKTH